MSRCRQTDALLDATFAGIELTRAQAEHVVSCADCAVAMAQLRRFDIGLTEAVAEIAGEPLPSTAGLGVANALEGGQPMPQSRMRALAAVSAVGVLVVAVVLGVGTLAPQLFGTPDDTAASPDQVNAWLDAAVVAAVESGGRNDHPSDWQPYQVEVCGPHAIAFFVERDPSSVRPFRWAIGQAAGTPSVAAMGIAGSLMDADVARARARLSLCSVFVDPSLGEAAARDAITRARDRWEGGEIPTDRFLDLRGAEVVDVSPMTRNLYSVLLERPDGVRTWLERVSLSLDEDQLHTMSGGALDSGVTRPQVVYRDNTPTHYFGLIDDPSVVALELLGADERLRYTVGAPGFILQGAAPSGQLHTYRFLAADGHVVAEGDLSPWPPSR
ncbi:MAG: hypothetical protein ACRDG7_03760 [Candidatus Limnocylindria bacterium]